MKYGEPRTGYRQVECNFPCGALHDVQQLISEDVLYINFRL